MTGAILCIVPGKTHFIEYSPKTWRRAVIMIELRRTSAYHRNSIIMRTQTYDTHKLRALLKRRKIARMDELKDALGAKGDITVSRKLNELMYYSSYSHRGSYYTLDEVANFDERGLWQCRSIYFSQHGTLVATTEAFVNQSEAGYFVDELLPILHVDPKDALRNLVQQDRVWREKMAGRYLYCSRKRATRKEQLAAREVKQQERSIERGRLDKDLTPDELRALIILFFSLLDEQTRRLYAGIESLKWGENGDSKVAEFLSIDVKTVARGRKQLLDQDIERDRVRKAGGGRIAVEKKRRR